MGNACGKEEEEEGETNSNSTSPEEAASLTLATEHAQQYIQAAFVDQDAAKAAQMLTKPNVKGFLKASVFGDELVLIDEPADSWDKRVVDSLPDGTAHVVASNRRSAITKTGLDTNQEDGHGDAFVTCLLKRCADDGSVLVSTNLGYRVHMGKEGKEIAWVYWWEEGEEPVSEMKDHLGWDELNWVVTLDGERKIAPGDSW